MMATLKAAPGTWIRVQVPGDPWPVTMSIGDEPPKAAFVDHVQGRRGEVTTHVSRRCPDLRPGRYTVRAITPDGVTETQLTVT